MSATYDDFKNVDQETIDKFKMTMKPEAIPNMGDMLSTVMELLAFIETPTMAKLEKDNYKEFESELYRNFNS